MHVISLYPRPPSLSSYSSPTSLLFPESEDARSAGKIQRNYYTRLKLELVAEKLYALL